MANEVRPPSALVPVEGRYRKAAEPFVGALELAFMSPDIIYNNEKYRLITIYSGRSGKIAAQHFHHFHVVDHTGKVVEQENIAQHCMNVYQMLFAHMISEKDLEYSISIDIEENEKRIESLKELKDIIVTSYDKNNRKPLKLFKDFDEAIAYLESVKMAEMQMHESASNLQKYDFTNAAILDEATFEEMRDLIIQFRKASRQKAIALMQHQGSLRMTVSLLKFDEMKQYLSDYQKHTAQALINYLNDEIEYQQIVYHAHDHLLVTTKGYIKKLEKIPDDFMRIAADQFLEKKWLVTKKRPAWFGAKK